MARTEGQSHHRHIPPIMPQSLSHILVHIIFSTKGREPLIPETAKTRLHAFLAGVARNAGHECPRVGGVADHVHLAIRLSRTGTVAALVEELKTTSSRWMKSEFEIENFSWQRGYAVFSVGTKDKEALLTYIDGQEAHHRTKTFEEEYRMFCRKNEAPLDERYAWD